MIQFKILASLLVISLLAFSPAYSTYDTVLDRIMNMAELGDIEENPASYVDDIRSANRKSWLNTRPDSHLGLSYRDFLGATNERDEEYLPENTLWGNQFISGGSGEQHLTPQGKQKTTKQEIKSDKNLPAYCNPPNPCPKGYTERDGCLKTFENSANNNRKYQESLNCPCDADHMFSCPAGSKVINTKSRKATASVGSGVAHALGDQESNEKRHSVVAKKSPMPGNPFQGQFLDNTNVNEDSLKRISKKSPYV